jgi:hypothetical protein
MDFTNDPEIYKSNKLRPARFIPNPESNWGHKKQDY